ncbi:MAG: hypothetical protein GYB65_07190 [Chloroflexi bacterium]|nr:hypothetical protein [Chloroflexota bacterium]
MAPEKNQPDYRLLTRMSESRCKDCPPDRVCAWGCIQGAGTADILIGAVLEQSQSWATETTEPSPESQALWDTFNS